MDIDLKKLERIVIEGIEISVNGRDLVLKCEDNKSNLTLTDYEENTITSRELKVRNASSIKFNM